LNGPEAGTRTDSQNPQSSVQDWALLATGTVNAYGVHLTAKYLSNGAYFYSPGGPNQPVQPEFKRLQHVDNGTVNYPQSLVFQNVGRPSFAPYDRMEENMLPYGDATPNREGLILFLSADIEKIGWLKPKSPIPSMSMKSNLIIF